MAEPVVYGPDFSTYVRTVRLTLEEKGAGYRLQPVDIFQGEAQTPEHLARQPFGKVPAFEHDGFALYETTAIARYVDEAFDGPALQPAEPRRRARMVQLQGIVDSYAYPVLISRIVIQRVVNPLLGAAVDEQAVAEAMEPAETAVKAIDGILAEGGRYAVGDDVSLADLHLAPVLAYLGQTPEGERLIAGAPALARWWEAVSARPSMARTAPELG